MSDLSGISRPVASAHADIDDITAAFDRRFKRMGGHQFNGSSASIPNGAGHIRVSGSYQI